MGNPLRKALEKSDERGPIILLTYADKLGFAHHMNFDFKWGRGERWHYVEQVEGKPEGKLAIIQGPLAEDVWKVLDGQKLDHKDWPEARLQGLEQKCRWYIERGRAA